MAAATVMEGGRPHRWAGGWPLREWLGLFVLWAIATACNLGKAVHVDDAAHLEIAKHIALQPLHPLSGTLFWGDTKEPIFFANQPHLFFYLLAGCVRLFGTGPLAPHLLIAAFTAMAMVLFHALARSEAPRWASALGVLVFLGPAFVPAQNMMADVPLLAFCLLALYGLYRDQADAARERYLLVAAIGVGLACLTKYTGLALLPVLAFATLRGRRRKRRVLIAVLPFAMLFGWSLFNWLDYGAVHLLGRPTPRASLGQLAVRGFEWVSCLGSLATFSTLLLPWAVRERLGRVVLVAMVTSGCVFAFIAMRLGHGLGVAIAATLFVENGVLTFGWLALDGSREIGSDAGRRRRLLLLWVAGLTAFIVLLSPFVAGRHVLLLLPALALLVAQRAELLGRAPIAIACGLTVALGAAVTVSDSIWAGVYPTEVSRLRARFGPDEPIWTVGHWGWQWYATQAGFSLYDPERATPPSGSLFVIPRLTHKQRIDPAFRARLAPLDADRYPASALTFVRTMSIEPWGGLYESTVEVPSWSLSRQPLEEFDLYRVR